MGLDGASLLTGIVIGFFYAGVLGMLFQKARDALQGSKSPDKPMVVPTKDTPRTVMSRAAAAFRRFMMWVLVIILVGGFGFYLLYRFIVSAQW
ncbi:MAG: hypothetical protein M9936_00785 [Caldilinea sp.]|nr:hypothetical protein [Caldilinea sp.]MCB0059420.1 hypothetical protein [Caldilineaceae bacterium]MCB0041451.1 hypothetical protein [Caldilinea sp.]MCB0054193.1 hypothetical protein [Caldilinea sp.]MCB9118666.1 hypothetical protein [Caldilineaceae bacterium]